MKRYLAVIEIDVVAEDDQEAARIAAEHIQALQGPLVYVLPIDDALEPWQAIDLETGDLYQARPDCFEFGS